MTFSSTSICLMLVALKFFHSCFINQVSKIWYTKQFKTNMSFSEYLLKLDKKRYKAFIKSKNSSLSYKYLQKVKVTSIDRRVDRSVKHSHIHVFEDHQKFIDQTNTKFRFRFPGCRPNTKLKKKKIVESSSTLTQNEGSLRKFNSKVVIAKRILFKPISNQIGYTPIINYHFLNL